MGNLRLRWVVVSLVLLALGAQARAQGFVKVRGTGFELDGKPYRFLGTNFWYGMNLGIDGPRGDRARLVRELDRLQQLGLKNLRIMAATEGPDGAPWRIAPSLQTAPGVYSAEVLAGLDFLLDEMRKRGMVAVVCLNNFWPWSGGMAQYLAWATGNAIPYPPPAAGGDWARYQAFTAKFYSNSKAVHYSHQLIRALVTRTNSYSGIKYAEDPAIMAWQLANEPRGDREVEPYNRWIAATASLIKRLDSNHLVTTGSEGETPWPAGSGLDLVRNHFYPSIDYATAHVWAQNWGWYDPAQADRTYPAAVAKMREYVKTHAAKAKTLGKPLVFEEFGISRDGNSHDPSSSVATRDRYYRAFFEAVEEAGAPVAGVNFWAWSGEGLPKAPYGGHWKENDPFTGDPPHESQGWYGVYAHDTSTIGVITEFVKRLTTSR